MKTRNKVLSLAAVLALGLGGFGGTFALWTVEQETSAVSVTSGKLALTTISDSGWIDLTAMTADEIATAVTAQSITGLSEVTPVPGTKFGKVLTITPTLVGNNLVAKLQASFEQATTTPFEVALDKAWTTDYTAAVAGDTAIEFTSGNITLKDPQEANPARIASGTAMKVLVTVAIPDSETGNMNTAVELPKVQVTADQVNPSTLKDAGTSVEENAEAPA